MFNNSTNKFLFNLVKKKPIYFLTSFFLSIISSLLNIIGTVCLIPLLIIILDDKQQNTQITQLNIFDYFFASFIKLAGEYKLEVILVLVFIVIILKNCATYLNSLVNIKHTKYLVYQMKSKGYSLLARVNLNYHQNNKTGDILFKLNREIDKTAIAIKSCQNILIISTIILLLTIFLLLISWQLTFICIFLLGLIALINQFITIIAQRAAITLSQKSKTYNHKSVEFLTGIRSIKTIGNETREYQLITRLIKDKDRAQLNTLAVSAIISPINEILGMIMIAILLIIVPYLYNQSIHNLALTFLIYLVVLCRLLPFFGQLNNARTQFYNSIASAEKVANFLKETDKPILKSGTIKFVELSSGIEFQKVTFAYPNHAQIILDKVDLWIPQGETIALVGSSEIGKLIITELLPRFHEPIDGQILIDGKNIAEYDIISLRKMIAIVNNNTFFFNNSLAYNITYGLKNISGSDIINAIKKVNIYEFVSQLPDGLNTEIGLNGILLTEGQKQRLAIARAMLHDSKILILDESSLGIDVFEDFLVRETIKELCRDRTTLIIAQRLSTIQQADRIIVLNKGRVIEVGTHAELLRQGDFYNRWYSMQFKTNNQSRQLKLAQKIAKKLARQTQGNLSTEIRQNFDSLLSYMQLFNKEIFQDDLEQKKILDESSQSAKDILANLKEYERKISRDPDHPNL